MTELEKESVSLNSDEEALMHINNDEFKQKLILKEVYIIFSILIHKLTIGRS